MSTDTLTALNNILQAEQESGDALEQLLETFNCLPEETLSTVSTQLWMASRDERWRIPIGESGVLAFFQSLIPVAKESKLRLNALKIVGNACAEKDANRHRVIQHPLGIEPFVNVLSDPESQLIASVVLLNICTDYEPSQLAAIEKGACQTLFSIIDSADFSGDLDYFLRVLEMLLTHDTGKAAVPDSALETLLRHLESGQESFDTALSLISIVISLLTTHHFQAFVLKGDRLFSRILDTIEKTYELPVDPEKEAKDKSLAAYARHQLTEVVGDIATEPDFLDSHPLDGEVMKRVRGWLEIKPGREELAVAACMVFGNVGRSDEVCAKLVQTGLHLPLFKVIEVTAAKFEESVKRAREPKAETETDTETETETDTGTETEMENQSPGAVSVAVIYAAAGVLKNLAISPQNKKALVDGGSFRAIRRMLTMEGVGVAQLWYSAVSLGRLSIINTFENTEKLLASSPDQESLLSLFLKRYSEAEELPVKVEISRTVAAILRNIYAGEENEANQTLLTALLSHSPVVEEALWDMVRQDKYPVVRSEGWFALALFGREPRGAKRIFPHLEAEKELVKTVLEGEKEKDSDNVGAIIAEVKRNSGEKSETIDELVKVFFRLRGVEM